MIFSEPILFQSPKQLSRHSRGWLLPTGQGAIAHQHGQQGRALTTKASSQAREQGRLSQQPIRQTQDSHTGPRSNQEIALRVRPMPGHQSQGSGPCSTWPTQGRATGTATLELSHQTKHNMGWRLSLDRACGCGSKPWEVVQGHQGFRVLTTVQAAILEPACSSFLIYLFLFKDCLLSKIRQRQESYFAFEIATMAYSGVSACSDSSAFKFVLDTVCLLHFALYLPIIYSLFI